MRSQEEYNVAKQQTRELYYKFNILNYKFQKTDEIGGVVLNSSWSLSSTSDIRRTATISLTPDSITLYKAKSGSKIWIDKYVQVYIGIKDGYTNNIIYTNMGIYTIFNPSQVYSSTDNTITLQLMDLMSKMTGQRGGSLDGYEYQIPQGTNIRSVIIDVLKMCGFTKYVISIDALDYAITQYDININADGSCYDILKEMNGMNVNYQMYFDVDGVFHYEKIPSGHNEQVFVDDDMWNKVYINHTINTNYENVKNDIIVLGRTHDTQSFGVAKLESNVYKVESADIVKLEDNTKIAFTTPSQITTNASISLNKFGTYTIKNQQGTQVVLDKDTYYVFRFNKDKKCWMYLSELTPRAEVKDTNPNSPFYINGTAGTLRIVLQGGEYDNIDSDDLARQRAEWELYTRCRLQDNVSIECVPLYWLDVNKVISIKFPNEDKAEKYIISDISISTDLGATQTIQAMKYYSFYE